MCVTLSVLYVCSHKQWTDRLTDLHTVNSAAVSTGMRLVSSILDSVPVGLLDHMVLALVVLNDFTAVQYSSN